MTKPMWFVDASLDKKTWVTVFSSRKKLYWMNVGTDGVAFWCGRVRRTRQPMSLFENFPFWRIRRNDKVEETGERK